MAWKRASTYTHPTDLGATFWKEHLPEERIKGASLLQQPQPALRQNLITMADGMADTS